MYRQNALKHEEKFMKPIVWYHKLYQRFRAREKKIPTILFPFAFIFAVIAEITVMMALTIWKLKFILPGLVLGIIVYIIVQIN